MKFIHIPMLSLVLTGLLLCGCQQTVLPAETADPPPWTTASAASQTEAGTAPSEAPAEQSGLTVHFLDVGQADCALLQCGGEAMLIDGGNREDSQLVVSYLEQQGVEELTAVVCSHAHEDHVGGLPGVLAVYPTAAVYAPTRTYASNIFDDFVYYTDQQGLEITIPAPGDSFSLGQATVTVLGPVQSYAEMNNTSIVLKVSHGEMDFLFTGDMETTAEGDMLDYWDDRVDWNCEVLKVGHHGSDTSTGYRFLSQVAPDYAVISVGADNSYGHPHEAPLSRLEQAEVTVLRTDQLGHIRVQSDGESLSLAWSSRDAQPSDQEPQETPQAEAFIGNRNSLKFHHPDCANLPSERNRVYFDSWQAALDAGYSPCGNCLS